MTTWGRAIWSTVSPASLWNPPLWSGRPWVAAAAHIGGNSKQGRPQRLGEDMVSVSEDGEIEVLGIGRSLCDRGGEELIKEKGHSHDPQRKFFLTASGPMLTGALKNRYFKTEAANNYYHATSKCSIYSSSANSSSRVTFKIKDEESINTSTSGNTVKTSNYRSRSKAKKSRAKSKSSNQVKSEDHHKKKKNDNNQNGPSDLIERLRRITMKYDKKEEEGGETGDTAFAEKQATDDSTGGNAPPTSEKEVDISDNEKVKAEAKLSLTDFPESKDEPSRLPTTGISTSIRPSESWDDSASQTSSQVAINSKASEKKSIGLLQKKKKEAKLGSIGDESPTTAEKSVSEIQPVKSDSSSVPTDKLVGSEPIKSANSDDSIKTEIVTKTEKRGESVEEKVTPEDDDSEIDNIAAAYTAVDVIESAELNNAEEGADSAKTGTKDKSGGVLNHIGLFPKPIEEKGLHEERQDGVLFFNPDEINVQHYVTDSEHEGFDGVLLNLNSPKLVDGYGDDSSTQPSTDIFCNEGEINDAMESVNANVHDFCRDELACDAGGPISSFRSLFRRIYPNANLAPVSSFESKDIIMSQHSDTSSLTQEKFTGLNLELNLDGTKQVADENCTQNTPW